MKNITKQVASTHHYIWAMIWLNIVALAYLISGKLLGLYVHQMFRVTASDYTDAGDFILVTATNKLVIPFWNYLIGAGILWAGAVAFWLCLVEFKKSRDLRV